MYIDEVEGELRLQGPQARCQYKEMLSVLSMGLQFIKKVGEGGGGQQRNNLDKIM